MLRERNSSRNRFAYYVPQRLHVAPSIWLHRELEQAICEQIDADIAGTGKSWDRVVKLVDLQVLQSEVKHCFAVPLNLPCRVNSSIWTIRVRTWPGCVKSLSRKRTNSKLNCGRYLYFAPWVCHNSWRSEKQDNGAASSPVFYSLFLFSPGPNIAAAKARLLALSLSLSTDGLSAIYDA